MSERLLSGGSQGTSIKLIASRLKQKGIKDEEIEECWNCFTQFPINEKNKLTAGDMRNYLQRLNNSQISLEFAEKGLGQLVGLKHATKSIDFEQFVNTLLQVREDAAAIGECIDAAVLSTGSSNKLAKWAIEGMTEPANHESIGERDLNGLVKAIDSRKL